LIPEEVLSMTSFKPVWALLALSCALLPVVGEGADDLAAVQVELQALKSEYAARLAELESRIAQLESGAIGPAAAAVAPPAAPPITPPAAQPSVATRSSAAAFNPAVSLILAGTYADISRIRRAGRSRASCRVAAKWGRERSSIC
jgi:hypothetical protein